MAQVTAQMVNSLRQRTGISMIDCKNALIEAEGNEETAIDILRKRGAIKAAKRADRSASEGCVQSYIHMGGRIGVLIELNCESDFVGKNEDFQAFARDICMHIAAAAPIAVRREEVPAELIARERDIAFSQVADKPLPAQEKIVEGKISKFLSSVCLLEQPFVKNPDQTIEQLIASQVQKLGENIQIRRFARFALGE